MVSIILVLCTLCVSAYAQEEICASNVPTFTFTEYSTVYATSNTTVTGIDVVTNLFSTASTILLSSRTSSTSPKSSQSLTPTIAEPTSTNVAGFEDVSESELYPVENAVSPGGWALGEGVFFYDNSAAGDMTTPYGNRFVVGRTPPGSAVSFEKSYRDRRRQTDTITMSLSYAYKILTDDASLSQCAIHATFDTVKVDTLYLHQADTRSIWTNRTATYTGTSTKGVLKIILDCTNASKYKRADDLLAVAWDEVHWTRIPNQGVTSVETSTTVSNLPSNTTAMVSTTTTTPESTTLESTTVASMTPVTEDRSSFQEIAMTNTEPPLQTSDMAANLSIISLSNVASSSTSNLDLMSTPSSTVDTPESSMSMIDTNNFTSTNQATLTSNMDGTLSGFSSVEYTTSQSALTSTTAVGNGAATSLDTFSVPMTTISNTTTNTAANTTATTTSSSCITSTTRLVQSEYCNQCTYIYNTCAALSGKLMYVSSGYTEFRTCLGQCDRNTQCIGVSWDPVTKECSFFSAITSDRTSGQSYVGLRTTCGMPDCRVYQDPNASTTTTSSTAPPVVPTSNSTTPALTLSTKPSVNVLTNSSSAQNVSLCTTFSTMATSKGGCGGCTYDINSCAMMSVSHRSAGNMSTHQDCMNYCDQFPNDCVIFSWDPSTTKCLFSYVEDPGYELPGSYYVGLRRSCPLSYCASYIDPRNLSITASTTNTTVAAADNTTNLTANLTPSLTTNVTLDLNASLTANLTASLTANLTTNLTINLTANLTTSLDLNLTTNLTISSNITTPKLPTCTNTGVTCFMPDYAFGSVSFAYYLTNSCSKTATVACPQVCNTVAHGNFFATLSGTCQPCVGSGYSCFYNTDCCSGTCVPATRLTGGLCT